MFRTMFVAVAAAMGTALGAPTPPLPAPLVITVHTYDTRDMGDCLAAEGWGWVTDTTVLPAAQRHGYAQATWRCAPRITPRTAETVTYCWDGAHEVPRARCQA